MDMKYVTIILLFVLLGCSKKESNVHFSVKQLQLNLSYSFYNDFSVILNFEDKFINFYSSNNTPDARHGVEFFPFKVSIDENDLVLIDSIIEDFDNEDFETLERELPLPDGGYFEIIFNGSDGIRKVVIYDYVKNEKQLRLIKQVLQLVMKYNKSEKNDLIINEIVQIIPIN